MRNLIWLTVCVAGLVMLGCASGEKQDPAPKGPPPQVNDAPAGAVPPGDTRGEGK